MDNPEITTPPRKKIKTEAGNFAHTLPKNPISPPHSTTSTLTKPWSSSSIEDAHTMLDLKELEVGITEFVSPHRAGFSGILKQRYTDFLVNEILPSGEVVHLDNLSATKQVDATNHDPVEAARAFSSMPAAKLERTQQTENSTSSNDTQTFHDGTKETMNEAPSLMGAGIASAQTSELSPSLPKLNPLASDFVVGSTVTGDGAADPLVSTQENDGRDHSNSPRIAMPKSEDLLPLKTEIIESVNGGSTSDTVSGSRIDLDKLGELKDPSLKDISNQEDPKPAPLKEHKPSDGTDGVSTWQKFTDKKPNFILSKEDKAHLESFFGEEVVAKIVELFNRVVNSPRRKLTEYGTVTSENITDRGIRTEIHKAIRRIFVERLDSYTDEKGSIVVTAASQGSRGWAGANDNHGRDARNAQNVNRPGTGARSKAEPRKSQREIFAELGGDYLHFSLYKMNKDTMEVVSYLARQLQTKPSSFNFAGTKDRRGVTVQRISVYRHLAPRLERVGKSLRGSKIGNYEYHPYGLSLGDLHGNEFVITLRDCQFPGIEAYNHQVHIQVASEIVGLAMKDLIEHGFLNYYGLQRFGTFATRTDVVGMKILRGDFQGAVEAILTIDPLSLEDSPDKPHDRQSADDKARAVAINIVQTTGNFREALQKLPRKYSAESSILRYLSQGRGNDYLGSIQSIPRNLRLMYVHAYQSVIWNLAASYRWKLAGRKVVEGDLVLVKEHKAEDHHSEDDEDADGEVIVRPAAGDRAESDRFETARPLTREEVDSNRYSIHDIVLPLPGFDVLYPSYMIEFYKSIMGSDQYGNLDPNDMRRPWKDFSLSGDYRKLLAKPGPSSSFEVVAYTEDDTQFVETDVDRIEKATNETLEDQKRLQEASSDNAGVDQVSMFDEAKRDSPEEKPAIGLQTTAEAPTDEAEMNDVNGTGKEEKLEKLAVILRLQLGSSQYATMALRELGLGYITAYKPDFGSGK